MRKDELLFSTKMSMKDRVKYALVSFLKLVASIITLCVLLFFVYKFVDFGYNIGFRSEFVLGIFAIAAVIVFIKIALLFEDAFKRK